MSSGVASTAPDLTYCEKARTVVCRQLTGTAMPIKNGERQMPTWSSPSPFSSP